MAIKVVHTKVSTIPDGDDSSLIRPSDWNADHSLEGLGTMAEQNANNVSITGGSISGATVSGYIPTTQKGVANGVATLDSGGTVPLSQLPPLGDLNYQGAWNANTNTPTLTSSVGTKGYYYVVSVAGTTNLNGITDWQIGDWAVFNGSVWQKIDNTDAVTSVNGYTGAVVLTYADVGAANAPTNTNITSMTGITGGISSPDYIAFDTTYATPLTAGQLGWDGNNTLAIGMAGGNVVQHIGEDSFFYVKASSAITKGQLVMFTGAVGASGVLTAAPSTGVTNPQYIMGIAAESIALNGFGLIQWFGEISGLNTNGFNEGDILYYDSAVAGGLTNTFPTSGPIVTVAAVAKKSSGNGVLYVRVSVTDRLTASTGISVSQSVTGTSITNTAPDQTVSITGGGTTTVTGTYPNFTVSSADQYTGTVTSVAATAGTGISITGSPITTSGTLNITNTAPDQTVVLTAGTGISTSGTYPNFTITNTSPSSGGTVTSITAGTGLSGGTITTSGTIALANTTVSAGSYTNSSITVDAQGRLTSASSGTAPVTSVSGTTGRITSTGGTTPVIDLASGIATAGTTGSSTLIPVVTIDTYGRVTSITTASNPQGTVTSVSGTGTVSGISLSGTVTSSGSLTLGGTLDLSSPPAIGGTTANAITGTTITATKFVGVSGGTF